VRPGTTQSGKGEQLLGLGEDEAFEVRACDKKESVRWKCEKRFGKRNKGDYEDGASRGGIWVLGWDWDMAGLGLGLGVLVLAGAGLSGDS